MKKLLTSEQIDEVVRKLGQQIASEYKDRPLTILGVLTGSIVFLADLIRNIDIPLRVGLIQASSYRGETTKPGDLNINAEILPELEGRDVILIDDIFDTGETLTEVVSQIEKKAPASVKSLVLLSKDVPHNTDYRPDIALFDIEDRFVVGYGLDYKEYYRGLPDIYAIER